MKLFDWLVAILLVVIGVGCLTMSATWMMGSGSIISNFFSICMWIGIPLIIVAIVYFIIIFKRGVRK